MVTYRIPSRVARSNDRVRKAIENFHYITGNPKVMEESYVLKEPVDETAEEELPTE